MKSAFLSHIFERTTTKIMKSNFECGLCAYANCCGHSHTTTFCGDFAPVDVGLFCAVATTELRRVAMNYDKSFDYFYHMLVADVCDDLRNGRIGYVYSTDQAEDVAKKLWPSGYDVRVCGARDGAIMLRAEKEEAL